MGILKMTHPEDLLQAQAKYCALAKKTDRDGIIERFLLGTQILCAIKKLNPQEDQWRLARLKIKTELRAIANYTLSIFYNAYQHAERPLELDCSKEEFFEMIISTPESAEIFCHLETPSNLYLFFMLHLNLRNGDQQSLMRYKELLHITDLQFIALRRHYDQWMKAVTNLFAFYALPAEKKGLLERTLTRFKSNTALHIANQRHAETLTDHATLLDSYLLEKLLIFTLILLCSQFTKITLPLQSIIPLMGLYQLFSYHSVDIDDPPSNRFTPTELSVHHFRNLILHGHKGNADAALDHLQVALKNYEHAVVTLPKMKSFMATLTMIFFIGYTYYCRNILTSMTGLFWFSALSLLQRACLMVINNYDTPHPISSGLFKPATPIAQDPNAASKSKTMTA